ncbi:2-oxoglutarate and iron-dependent oxygenase domain-containing protein, partial [Myxococcota bacterium]|nr:2-oxoglutarate and iron-dependent oxygenase domain-containing protein [Myxococcota bacterium]
MEIPTIDFSQLDHDHPLSELERACSEWGFFHLKNHGMPRTLRAGLLREAAAFFALPSESKHKVLRTRESSWGFYDRELTKNRRDWKEIFEVGREEGS